MKEYPSFDGHIVSGKPYYAFSKLDGSNVRCEWHPKKGFWKFGSRTQLLDEKSSELGAKAVPLMKAQEEEFTRVFKKAKIQEATLFFEFFGPSSFAGVHNFQEEGLRTVLIDCCVYKKGFLLPQEFIKLFSGEVEHAEHLYTGNVSEEFVKSVKESTLEGMAFEGVICKGAPLKNGYQPHMFKVKSNAWIERVKALYTDPKKLQELL